MKHLVAPSIFSCDFSVLNEEIDMINKSDADWVHCDVMDGIFVPNISFGFPIISTIKKHAKKPLDVHLMIEHPENYINEFKSAGADILTVHYEACTHLHGVIRQIKKEGMKAGVALNPHSSIGSLQNILTEIDLVVIMSVNPGFGGQQFIERSVQKVYDMRLMIENENAGALIEVDGGVTLKNANSILQAGASILVAGSTVFNSTKPDDTIKKLKTIDINTIQV